MIFYPENRIGAIRPTNFAKHLKVFGHDVEVLALKLDESKESLEFPIHRVAYGRIISCVNTKLSDKRSDALHGNKATFKNGQRIKSKHKGRKSPYRIVALQFLDIMRSYSWYFQCKNFIKKNIGINDYDIVISSFGPLGSFLTGMYIKRKSIAKFWISDFRDRMMQIDFPKPINVFYLNKEQKAYKYADSILHVSKGTADTFAKDLNVSRLDKIHVIANGFERKQLIYEKPDSDVLSFSYTGSLYPNGKRSMKLIFVAIADCIKQGLINEGKIRILCAGRNIEILKEQSETYGINVVEICGFVPRQRAQQIQQDSDILIVLTWNEEKGQGIITGKFYEYLSLKKPIIALVSGNLPSAEISSMINDLQVGLSCEEANERTDVDKLKKYILMQYQRKQKGQDLLYKAVDDEVRKYDYVNLTKRLESICNDLVST